MFSKAINLKQQCYFIIIIIIILLGEKVETNNFKNRIIYPKLLYKSDDATCK